LKKISSLLLIIIIFGCSYNQTVRRRQPQSFQEQERFSIDIEIKKICYNDFKKVYYIWEANTDYVHIYHKGKKINTVGGKGFGRQNFQKLSDISLSADGYLYAFDSINRTLKKFDENGDLRAEIAISSDFQPQLAAVSIDGKIYIYDDERHDIVILDARGRETGSFGGLQFGEISSLDIQKDIISIYNADHKITFFYSRFGQYITEIEGQSFREYDEYYSLKEHYFEHQRSGRHFAMNPEGWRKMFYQEPWIILTGEKQIMTGKIDYAVD
jgi:WD40 repeat protein